MKNYNTTFRHACLMVIRNIKNYILLSVTIVLSFSFLLAFFLFSDSNIYNQYKVIFKTSPNVMNINSANAGYNDMGKDITLKRYQLLMDRMSKIENTYYYQYYENQMELTHYESDKVYINAKITYIPNNFWGIYGFDNENIYRKVDFINGSNMLNNENEIIIDQTFYNLLSHNGTDDITTVKIPVLNKEGLSVIKDFKIVGLVSSLTNPVKDTDKMIYYVNVYISQSLASDTGAQYVNRNMLVYSSNIQEITQYCKELSLGYYAPIQYQIEAKKAIQGQIYLKGIISIILFSLLSINLYSSFKNALNERCFEIGIKRALGANKRDIMKQFFYEGCLVMIINVCASVLLITNLSAIYKFVQIYFYSTEWTIYISIYSIFLYLFCVFFLSVIFSLVFAYQTTKIDIIKHLKAE